MGIMEITVSLYPRTGLTASQKFRGYDLFLLRFEDCEVRKETCQES